jgi:hypothetical protein
MRTSEVAYNSFEFFARKLGIAARMTRELTEHSKFHETAGIL